MLNGTCTCSSLCLSPSRYLKPHHSLQRSTKKTRKSRIQKRARFAHVSPMSPEVTSLTSCFKRSRPGCHHCSTCKTERASAKTVRQQQSWTILKHIHMFRAFSAVTGSYIPYFLLGARGALDFTAIRRKTQAQRGLQQQLQVISDRFTCFHGRICFNYSPCHCQMLLQGSGCRFRLRKPIQNTVPPA